MADQAGVVSQENPAIEYASTNTSNGQHSSIEYGTGAGAGGGGGGGGGDSSTNMDEPRHKFNQQSEAEATAMAASVYDSAAAATTVNGNEGQVPPSVTATATATASDYASADAAHYAAAQQSADENGSIMVTENKEGQPQYQQDAAVTSEEERLWTIVRANSADFDAWTALIQETEKAPDEHLLPKARKVYDAFLAEFPLCYGYWKKYADHEGRLGSPEKIVEVYERAVQAVTYSVEIWDHYVVFAISTYDDPETIRRLFERGLYYVGTDYMSARLWDKYIEYETAQQQWSRLAEIYTRLLQIPTQQLDHYFNRFKELASSRPLMELKTEQENAAAAVRSSTAGNEAPSESADAQQPEAVGPNEAEELEAYIAVREDMYRKTKEFDTRIRDFENAIRRPYFHARPLEENQLVNWRRYLDFTDKLQDLNRTVKLYERCLIPCANYPEFWIRYVQCMEANESLELANNALERATRVFVKRRPEIHLFAATFKELTGDVAGARAEYQLLTTELVPGLLEAVVKYACMEQREGNTEAAISIFETAIATEKANEQSQFRPMLYIQYCRFLKLVLNNAAKATEVLTEAFELHPYSKSLFELAVHLEAISDSKRVDYLDSVVERMLTAKPDGSYGLSAVDREEISGIFLEFLDMFGDAKAIKKAESRHRFHFLAQNNSLESRKRRAEDSLTSEKNKVAKSYTGASSAASPAQISYPNGQAQWGAGYTQQAAWQQPPTQATPQMQPQQWVPGYGQQGGYAPYGAYPNYGPQQPASSAQQGYTAYGQGYQAQAYPQQSYGQPAPVYSAPQQQASASQYYSGYY